MICSLLSVVLITNLALTADSDVDSTSIGRKIEKFLAGSEYPKAFELVNKALRENPDNLTLRELRIRILAEWGKSEQAIAEYITLSQQANQNFPRLLYKIGLGALENQSGFVRTSALQSISELADAEAIPYLEKSIKREPTPLALATLGKLGAKSSISLLIECTKVKDPKVRIAAATSLVKLADTRGAAILKEEFFKGDAKTKMECAQALADLGDRSIIPFLQEAMKKKDLKLKFHAALCLVKLGEKGAISVLEKGLRDDDELTSIRAAYALAELEDKSVVPFLQKALKSEEKTGFIVRIPIVKIAALESIIKVGDKSVAHDLIEVLKSKDRELKIFSLQKVLSAIALGKIGDQGAVPFLIAEFINKENSEIEKVPIAIALWRLMSDGDQKHLH